MVLAVVLALQFKILYQVQVALHRAVLPVQDLAALLQVVLVHHLHQVLEVIQITIPPVLQDFLTHVIMDIQILHMRCAPADLKD